MIPENTITQKKQTVYATSGDFCRIFGEDMNALYRLALILTADERLAEQCFVLSLEDAIGGAPVFKEWARSWARRTIVRNAIGLVLPKPGGSNRRTFVEAGVAEETRAPEALFEAPLSLVLDLPAFDRFVFTITALEKMREHECCLLLGCSLREVISARRRVLEALGERGGISGQAREFLQPAQVA